MAYILDSNVFINAKNSYYGFKLCPGFWQWLDVAYSEGKIFSIKNVRDELLEREDLLSHWCKTRKQFFKDTNDVKTYESLRILATWVTQNYSAAAQAKFFEDADFKLVGFAHAHNHIVVTSETMGTGQVKIPNACKMMAVKCMSPFEMLNLEKVQFHISK